MVARRERMLIPWRDRGNMSGILEEKPKVLNIGPLYSYEDLKEQGVEAQQIDWRPLGVSGDMEELY